MQRLRVALMVGLVGISGCAASDEALDAMTMDEPVALGPVDGHELPGIELERVQVGQMAPDFTLAALAGDRVTLSGFQGASNIVLVFYRGHW
ncbi:MAG: redoxin domain-containing protein [Longimicrobiales bacterium]|nr:redoxin domain-containing protein [Longimicrobiales bacterium]